MFQLCCEPFPNFQDTEQTAQRGQVNLPEPPVGGLNTEGMGLRWFKFKKIVYPNFFYASPLLDQS